MPVVAEKQALRAKVLAARARMAPSQLLTAADALLVRLIDFLGGYPAQVIAAHVPIGSEPGGPTLPSQLAAAFPDTTLLLPILLPDLDLDWAVYSGPSSIARTTRGLYEPTGPRLGPSAIATARVAIVPALAVDTSGYRLGRGGGSYDRALARFTGVSVALLHEGELLPHVPHAPHDIPVGFAFSGLPSG